MAKQYVAAEMFLVLLVHPREELRIGEYIQFPYHTMSSSREAFAAPLREQTESARMITGGVSGKPALPVSRESPVAPRGIHNHVKLQPKALLVMVYQSVFARVNASSASSL